MTVKELIEELQEAPQDVPVCVVRKFVDHVNIGEPEVVWAMDDGRIVRVVLQ